jgi:hypothetical protein
MSTTAPTIKIGTPKSGPISFSTVMRYIAIALGVSLLVALVFYIANKTSQYYNTSKDNVSNGPNNYRIVTEQVKKFESMYMRMPDRLTAFQAEVKGLLAKLGDKSVPSSAANTLTIPPLAADEKALINYSVLTCNNAGYMGPRVNGVFSEDNAIRIAYRAGARAFVLRIDTTAASKSPQLVVRNLGNNKISNNTGSIKKTINAIANYAPTGASSEPIIVILFFNNLPSKNPYSPDSQRFMEDVASELGALKTRHLGMTPHGDFRRQQLADKLFIYDRSEFDGKFIILTNVDTKVFRQKRVSSDRDLDLWVHAQLYADTTNGIGVTEVPKNAKMVSPRLETPSYFINIPDERLTTSLARTKVEWTVGMDGITPKQSPSRENLLFMLDKIGVSCIPLDLFDTNTKELLDGGMAEDIYGRVSWRPKLPELRYKKPKPIILASPSKQLDAKGGLLPVPKV